MILVIKHIDIEGLGTAEESFRKAGFTLQILELPQDDSFPEDLSQTEAVIVLGGPMNVYQEEEYPFLRKENIFLQKIIRHQIPLLGICLGAQLIAKTCGAAVKKFPVREIGWSKVFLTDAGKKDVLFKDISDTLDVFQWHEDTFDIPVGGVLLATSQGCPHQAFKIGTCAYGIQFHIEIDENDIKNWVKRYFQVKEALADERGRKMIEQYRVIKKVFHQQVETICLNFISLIKG